MKIEVFRDKPSKVAMTGDMHIDGAFHSYTLEDVPRGTKIKGETAIPAGTYDVVLTYSWRFKRILPLLLEVPNFSGIRIHGGNTSRDVQGCIAVGDIKGKDYIADCKPALDVLIDKIKRAKEKKEKVTITLTDFKESA